MTQSFSKLFEMLNGTANIGEYVLVKLEIPEC